MLYSASHVAQASICTELIKRLLQFGPALIAASAAVAELDCLCSLAAAARELGYCRPQLVQESVIHIEGGESSPWAVTHIERSESSPSVVMLSREVR